MSQMITVEELEQFCRDYDAWHGEYRESVYEGWAMLCYIRRRLDGLPANLSRWPYIDNDIPDGWSSESEQRRVRE
jgi:hypothetical protein